MSYYDEPHGLEVGDKVVLVDFDSFGGDANATVSREMTVSKVLKTRVVVSAVGETGGKEYRFVVDKWGRIDRQEGRESWHSPKVLRADSERVKKIFAAKEIRALRGETRAALADWSKKADNQSLNDIDEAIAALQKLRAAYMAED